MDAQSSEVVELFNRRSEAMHAKDIEGLMSLYAPDVVYFDLVPPLHYTGWDALRSRFLNWFEGWSGPIGMDTEGLNVAVSGDLAAAHMLLRASGTRTNGHDVGYWVRTTNSCHRSGGGWLITHEHVSLPVDFESRSAVMDLSP
jgi:ketosteroid isomerase-like protein